MNLANKLTIARMIMIPILIAIYMMNFIPYNGYIALFIFTLAILTDFVDGRVARNRNEVTNLGKVLDPVADKLIIVATILLLMTDSVMNLYIGMLVIFIMITRDYLVTGLRQISASEGSVIAAGNLGKIKTVSQSIAIIIFLVYKGLGATGYIPVLVFAYIALSIAVALTVISGYTYIYNGRHLLKK